MALTTAEMYKQRVPTGGSSDVSYNQSVEAQLAAAGGSPSQYPYSPGYRYINQGGRMVLADTPGLVDRFGNVVASPGGELYYNLDNDPRGIYGSSNPTGRRLLIESLVAAGFLPEDYIGDYGSEIRALTEAMDYANTLGLELNNALQQRIAGGVQTKKRTSGGAIRTYRTTNTQDLVTLAKQVSRETIGREISDAEAAAFAQQYQSQEVSFQKQAYAGGQAMEPPSAEVSAINYLRTTQPREEAAYKYLGYANKLFQMIGVG